MAKLITVTRYVSEITPEMIAEGWVRSDEEPESKYTANIYDLKLHETLSVTDFPYFQVMRVASGWLYNFWDAAKDDYRTEWIFVPFDNKFQ